MTRPIRRTLAALSGVAVAAVLAATIGVVAWRHRTPPPAARAAVAPGSVQAAKATFQMAVYYLPRPQGDPLTVTGDLLTGEFKMFERVGRASDPLRRPQVSLRRVSDVANTYKPPSRASLGHFGRGLTEAQAEALHGSQEAFVLDFDIPAAQVWVGVKAAERLVAAVARATGGLIWDESTRQVYTPEAWKESRLAPWTGDVPEVALHTVIHSYETRGAGVRSISLGMQKFALPDLVIEGSSWSIDANMGHFINLTFQHSGIRSLEFT